MNIELKPCPFCGGRASVYGWQSVVGIGCSDEDCPGSMLSEWCFGTTYDAAEVWNTRAERTCRVESERVIDYSYAVQRAEWTFDLSCGHSVTWDECPDYCPVCGAKVVE